MSMDAVSSSTPEFGNGNAPVAGGGSPYDAGMDRRLTVLETHFHTILPTLATKADLAELRLDVARMVFDLQAELADKTNKL